MSAREPAVAPASPLARPDFSLVLAAGGGVVPAGPCRTVAAGARTAHVVGDVEFIVDYERLALRRADDAGVREVLARLLAQGDIVAAADILTELSGDFVAAIEDGGTTWLYKSEELGTPVYMRAAGGAIVIGQSWRDVGHRTGGLAADAGAVATFLREGQVKPPGTFFPRLAQLLPYTLYRRDGTRLVEVAHTFPGLHVVRARGARDLTTEHFCKALGCHVEHVPAVSLGFSGGSDSTLLLRTYGAKVSELLTLHYLPPFHSHKREEDRRRSLAAGAATGKPSHIVAIDWGDVAALHGFQRVFADASPFSSFPAAHYYAMIARAASPYVMTGQNADNVFDWGFHQLAIGARSRSSSAHDLDAERSFWRTHVLRSGVSARGAAAAVTRRYLVRALLALSFRRLVGRRVISRWYPLDGPWRRLAEFPYKLFTIHRVLNYFICGEATAWRAAASHAGKRMLYPYTSPLALHVASHIRRTNYLDLKSPIRWIAPAIEVPNPAPGSPELTDGRPFWDSPLFDTAAPPDLAAAAGGGAPVPPSVARIAATHLALVLDLAAGGRST